MGNASGKEKTKQGGEYIQDFQRGATTWPGPIQPVFWKGRFLKALLLFGQAKIVLKNFLMVPFLV